jgi:hypothetical protein
VEFVFFSDEPWFTSYGNVNSHNNTQWCSENLITGQEILLQNKVQVSSAVSAFKTTRVIFSKK